MEYQEVCLDEVQFLLKSLGVKTELVDERYIGKPINVEFHGFLRTQQEKAVEALFKYDTGVLSASTAFGKTVVAIESDSQTKCKHACFSSSKALARSMGCSLK